MHQLGGSFMCTREWNNMPALQDMIILARLKEPHETLLPTTIIISEIPKMKLLYFIQ